MKQKFVFTPQAAGAIMMAMQKGIKKASEGATPEECNITNMILEFELESTPSGLIVNNPPILEYDNEEVLEGEV